ncbi:MAG TPA: SemiSWEET family transporter [Chryseolinea sp.]
MDKTTIIGVGASVLTSTSLIPQLSKLIREKKADDISVTMLLVLFGGLGLWIYYGILKDDLIIIISNTFALIVNLATVVLTFVYKR